MTEGDKNLWAGLGMFVAGLFLGLTIMAIATRAACAESILLQ